MKDGVFVIRENGTHNLIRKVKFTKATKERVFKRLANNYDWDHVYLKEEK